MTRDTARKSHRAGSYRICRKELRLPIRVLALCRAVVQFRTYVLPVHEIENYLLDSSALSASRFNNRRPSERDIQTIIEEAAGRLCWWGGLSRSRG